MIKFSGDCLIVPEDDSLLQCAVQNNRTKEWFLSQTTNVGTKFHRFDKDCKYMGFMSLYKGGHGTAFGIEDDNTIWASCDDDQKDIVSFKYRDGDIIRKDKTKQMHVFTENGSQIAFSPSRKYAVIREYTSAIIEVYSRYAVADLRKGVNNLTFKPLFLKRVPNVQGFTIRNEFLYRMIGGINTNAYIEKFDLRSGSLVGKLDITRIGYLPGEKKGNREPEGMDGLRFGVKVRVNGIRRIRIFDFDF